MKFSKIAIVAALCALFTVQVEARTLYVNASRPNNKGNGLKLKTAKKTIQAAINIAKKGDTILVYPGTYAPIKTNNKKITIKSIKGKGKTRISGKVFGYAVALANLGRKKTTYEYVTTDVGLGSWQLAKVPRFFVKGTSTVFAGFSIKAPIGAGYFPGVLGGTLKNSTILGIKSEDIWSCAAENSKLENCLVENVYCTTGGCLFKGCTLQRCIIKGNTFDYWNWNHDGPMIDATRFYNCLILGNSVTGAAFFTNSTLVNCTLVSNSVSQVEYISGAYEPPQTSPIFTTRTKIYNGILWNNVLQNRLWVDGYWDSDTDEWVEGRYDYGESSVHNFDVGNTYKNTDTTNKDPKFVNAARGNYKLKKGSYCIDKGKLTASQKKLVGSKDLAGRKRIRGKAIDRGCYEY